MPRLATGIRTMPMYDTALTAAGQQRVTQASGLPGRPTLMQASQEHTLRCFTPPATASQVCMQEVVTTVTSGRLG